MKLLTSEEILELNIKAIKQRFAEGEWNNLVIETFKYVIKNPKYYSNEIYQCNVLFRDWQDCGYENIQNLADEIIYILNDDSLILDEARYFCLDAINCNKKKLDYTIFLDAIKCRLEFDKLIDFEDTYFMCAKNNVKLCQEILNYHSSQKQ